MNDYVIWEAVHCGIRQRLTVKITEFEKPYRFVAEMVKGIFKSKRHEFVFSSTDTGTVMIDTFYYVSPTKETSRVKSNVIE